MCILNVFYFLVLNSDCKTLTEYNPGLPAENQLGRCTEQYDC